MADFNTNNHEEMLIDRVRKIGFGYAEDSEFPKYLVLRVALGRALNAPKMALNSPDWLDKRLDGERGKEYNLEQITGKGKDKKEDFDILIRSMLYIKHKEELDRDKKDIFNNEKEYLNILGRYIQRGLYEINNTWKNNDCFYQWCLDHLELFYTQNTQDIHPIQSSPNNYFVKIESFFRQQGVGLKLISEYDSYRHHICKIELTDSNKIEPFKRKSQYLDDELGKSVYIEKLKNIGRAYGIQIQKLQSQWQNPDLRDFQQGLAYLQKQSYALGVFAGMDIDKKPVCFDLKDAPHLLVAGTTGSGKSVLLKNIILCLLQNKEIKITIIDPKLGSFSEFEKLKNITIIKESKDYMAYIQKLVEEMESRYERHSKGESYENMPYEVVIVDELNDLVMQDKNINDTLARLAQKARECKIHLVLASQRPDSATFSGALRSNIPSRIALSVQKGAESKIILDELGAEKLSGKGDMLLKLNGKDTLRAFGVYLSPKELQTQLKKLQ